jgi:DNA (cytosine-5)-methyltransferase 1
VSQQSISRVQDSIQQTSKLRIGSLCTGYGGLDLAVEAHFNAETIWCAEFDKYASEVIKHHFNVPNYGNIKTINWASMPQIDILTAGYPCQPFSHAGERKGTQDERHLFPYIAEAISNLRPRWVVLENVRGHLSLGLKEVLAHLASIGYDARWQTVRAADAGAPHRRERVFIVAEPSNTNGKRFTLGQERSYADRHQGQSQSELSGMGEAASNTNNQYQSHNREVQKLGRRFMARCEMHLLPAPDALDQDGKLSALFVEYMMGLPSGWITDSGLSRAQQLKMLGNGVVPQQAEYALDLLTVVDNYVE